MPDTQLRQNGVDRADLHAVATAIIPQRRRFNMIATIGNKQRQDGKAVNDLTSVSRAAEPLKKLLKH